MVSSMWVAIVSALRGFRKQALVRTRQHAHQACCRVFPVAAPEEPTLALVVWVVSVVVAATAERPAEPLLRATSYAAGVPVKMAKVLPATRASQDTAEALCTSSLAGKSISKVESTPPVKAVAAA